MNKRIKSLLLIATGGMAGVFLTQSMLNKKLREQSEYARKHLEIIKVFNKWMMDMQSGKNIEKYFQEHGYKSIAVYGMSFLGERLVDELRDSGINVKYGIDKNAANIYADIEVKDLSDDLPQVDAVIVTAIYFFDEIEEELSRLIDAPIISLEDVLYEVR